MSKQNAFRAYVTQVFCIDLCELLISAKGLLKQAQAKGLPSKDADALVSMLRRERLEAHTIVDMDIAFPNPNVDAEVYDITVAKMKKRLSYDRGQVTKLSNRIRKGE